MADVRHWGLVLICILFTAWQNGVFADIFAPVHDDDMSTRFLCARSCTAKIFVYTKVRALANCNLFQPVDGLINLQGILWKKLSLWSFTVICFEIVVFYLFCHLLIMILRSSLGLCLFYLPIFVSLSISFCNIFIEQFREVAFIHFINVSWFICRNKSFITAVNCFDVIGELTLKVVAYNLNSMFLIMMYRSCSRFVKLRTNGTLLCWKTIRQFTVVFNRP